MEILQAGTRLIPIPWHDTERDLHDIGLRRGGSHPESQTTSSAPTSHFPICGCDQSLQGVCLQCSSSPCTSVARHTARQTSLLNSITCMSPTQGRPYSVRLGCVFMKSADDTASSHMNSLPRPWYSGPATLRCLETATKVCEALLKQRVAEPVKPVVTHGPGQVHRGSDCRQVGSAGKDVT